MICCLKKFTLLTKKKSIQHSLKNVSVLEDEIAVVCLKWICFSLFMAHSKKAKHKKKTKKPWNWFPLYINFINNLNIFKIYLPKNFESSILNRIKKIVVFFFNSLHQVESSIRCNVNLVIFCIHSYWFMISHCWDA